MSGICPECGNYKWDKQVSGNMIKCPECRHTWRFKRLPLFILTGCSGIGKTTAAQELMRQNANVVVLDADIYCGVMPLNSDEDYQKMVESMENFSKNIMQSGLPVLWTMAGNLDKLSKTYNCRFFSGIHCLALVCNEKELFRRMTVGRGITDKAWIDGSIAYNNYFMTHMAVDNMAFNIFDVSDKSVSDTAEYILEWINGILIYSI